MERDVACVLSWNAIASVFLPCAPFMVANISKKFYGEFFQTITVNIALGQTTMKEFHTALLRHALLMYKTFLRLPNC
ncbi:CLUMA_CG011538, isoform A [Clunio marinus]|uniref:CLUMA_CG011538, isoform A n=1 Tax=Clunio marinus TaxID=568069 RepID=A0A1J1IF41_9DIPT|nr:CLUMA_CG011538, isoform A [Clunio marinus]